MRTMRWLRSGKLQALAGLGLVAVVLALPAPDSATSEPQPEAQLLAAVAGDSPPDAPPVAVAEAPAESAAAVRTVGPPAATLTAVATPAVAEMPKPAAVEVKLPSLASAEELIREHGFIGLAAVNVRSAPSTSAAPLLVAQPGTPVSIGARENNWVHVTLPGGSSGWVYSRYVGSEAPAAGSAQQQAEATPPVRTRKPAAALPRGGDLVVQAAPSRGAPTLFVLAPGDRIKVSERRGRWLRVVTESGVSGWVRAD